MYPPPMHIQNQVVRTLIRSSYNAHVTPLFLQLNLLCTDELIEYNLGISAYRLIRTPRLLHGTGINHLPSLNITRFSLQNNFLLSKVHTNSWLPNCDLLPQNYKILEQFSPHCKNCTINFAFHNIAVVIHTWTIIRHLGSCLYILKC